MMKTLVKSEFNPRTKDSLRFSVRKILSFNLSPEEANAFYKDYNLSGRKTKAPSKDGKPAFKSKYLPAKKLMGMHL
jgi:hypothetical protein